jgi:hypothetical protein
LTAAAPSAQLERVTLRARNILSLCLALGGLGGCAMPTELPGQHVGAYSVSGELTENSCGSAAVPAVDPLQFNVEVRENQGTGLWLQGTPPGKPGKLEDDGAFRFRLESRYNVPGMAPDPVEMLIYTDIEKLADPDTYDNLDRKSDEPCQLLVSETVEGRLLNDDRQAGATGTGAKSSASGTPDLIGENEIAIRGAAGDCSLVLADQGGPFDDLPCRVHYELEGALVAQ